MARTDPQINFRLPQELKSRIELSAKENGRSVTQEVISRIESTYNPPLTDTETITRMANEITDLSTENREMRRLYIEFLHKNFIHIPLGLKSTYGKLLNRLLEDLTDEERQEIIKNTPNLEERKYF